MPVVSRGAEGERRGARDQHRVAGIVSGVSRSGGVLRGEIGATFTDAQSGMRMGARRNFGERDRARNFSYEIEQRPGEGHAARERIAYANADGSLRKTGGTGGSGGAARVGRPAPSYRAVHRGGRGVSFVRRAIVARVSH